MAIKTRNDLEFEVIYSIHIERMMFTLLGRLDRFSSFSQILLGATVITNLAPTAVGLSVAAIAAAQLVWQPGVKATEAKASHDRWQALRIGIGKRSADEIEAQIAQTCDRDGAVFGSLKLPAHLAAGVQMGLDISSFPKVSRWQRLVAFCAGGMPVI
jgi:hypothetical protein